MEEKGTVQSISIFLLSQDIAQITVEVYGQDQQSLAKMAIFNYSKGQATIKRAIGDFYLTVYNADKRIANRFRVDRQNLTAGHRKGEFSVIKTFPLYELHLEIFFQGRKAPTQKHILEDRGYQILAMQLAGQTLKKIQASLVRKFQLQQFRKQIQSQKPKNKYAHCKKKSNMMAAVSTPQNQSKRSSAQVRRNSDKYTQEKQSSQSSKTLDQSFKPTKNKFKDSSADQKQQIRLSENQEAKKFPRISLKKSHTYSQKNGELDSQDQIVFKQSKFKPAAPKVIKDNRETGNKDQTSTMAVSSKLEKIFDIVSCQQKQNRVLKLKASKTAVPNFMKQLQLKTLKQLSSQGNMLSIIQAELHGGNHKFQYQQKIPKQNQNQAKPRQKPSQSTSCYRKGQAYETINSYHFKKIYG